MKQIRVCLAGATGKMGREVLKALPSWVGIELVSALASKNAGKKLHDFFDGRVKERHVPNLVLGKDLLEELKSTQAEVLVDLTTPDVTTAHALCAIENGVAPVIGTSGISPEDLQKIEKAAKQQNIPAIIVPNFSIGAVLGMRFAQIAARWISDVEIIEAHHDQKLDAPSGTALATSQLIRQARKRPSSVPETQFIKVPGVRGGLAHEVPIHSIRLKGVLAEQSVIFGSPGETLEIKHTVIDRSTYMRGVELSIRKMSDFKGSGRVGLKMGLETLLFEENQ